MPCGDVLGGTITVPTLVIEEYVCVKGFEKFGFIDAAKEKRFIQFDIPFTQGPNHPFMGRRPTCGHQGSSNWAIVLTKLSLKPV